MSARPQPAAKCSGVRPPGSRRFGFEGGSARFSSQSTSSAKPLQHACERVSDGRVRGATGEGRASARRRRGGKRVASGRRDGTTGEEDDPSPVAGRTSCSRSGGKRTCASGPELARSTPPGASHENRGASPHAFSPGATACSRRPRVPADLAAPPPVGVGMGVGAGARRGTRVANEREGRGDIPRRCVASRARTRNRPGERTTCARARGVARSRPTRRRETLGEGDARTHPPGREDKNRPKFIALPVSKMLFCRIHTAKQVGKKMHASEDYPPRSPFGTPRGAAVTRTRVHNAEAPW